MWLFDWCGLSMKKLRWLRCNISGMFSCGSQLLRWKSVPNVAVVQVLVFCETILRLSN